MSEYHGFQVSQSQNHSFHSMRPPYKVSDTHRFEGLISEATDPDGQTTFFAQQSICERYSTDEVYAVVMQFFSWISLHTGWCSSDFCDAFYIYQGATGYSQNERSENGGGNNRVLAINEQALEQPISISHPLYLAIRNQRWVVPGHGVMVAEQFEFSGEAQQQAYRSVHQAAELLWIDLKDYIDQVAVFDEVHARRDCLGYLNVSRFAPERILLLRSDIPSDIDSVEIALHLLMHALIQTHEKQPYFPETVRQLFSTEPTLLELKALQDLYARAHAIAIYRENIGPLTQQRAEDLLNMMLQQVKVLPVSVQECVVMQLLKPLQISQ